jgi:hypothetical protein
VNLRKADVMRAGFSPVPVTVARIVAVAIGTVGLLAATPAAASTNGPQATRATASAGPALALSVSTGPPTTSVKADGSGFLAHDAITVTFDGTTVATATASPNGTFAARFGVPAAATPGPHAVRSFDSAGAAATATFTVQTNWPSARFSPSGSGFNPYENVLGPANAARLRQVAGPQWGAFLHSEPIYAGGLLIVGSSDGTVREFEPTGDQRWHASGRPVIVLAGFSPPWPGRAGHGSGR